MTIMDENSETHSNTKIGRQTYGSILSSLTILISSFWTAYISPVLIKFENNEMDFNITSTETTWIVSIMDFGNFLSPIMAGTFMDYFGRKQTLTISTLIHLICATLVLTSTSGVQLFFARLLAGVAKGFTFTVTPIYVAEISSKTIRGALSTFFYTFFCIGIVLASTVGLYVSFQTFNLISLLLPLLLLVFSYPMPESPYYYVMKGNYEDARKSLNWYRKTCTDHTLLRTENEFQEIIETIKAQDAIKGSYKELFTDKVFRKALVIVSLTGLTQRFGGISYFLSYGTSDLPESHTRFGPKECYVAFSVISLFASILTAFLVDKVGRKPILLSSTITTSIALFIGAIYFNLFPGKSDPEYYWIPYSVVIFFSFSFSLGLGVLPATFQGEMFPSKIKRHASATVIMLLSLGSFLVNLSHEFVTTHYGVAGNYYIAAISDFLFAIYAFAYIFETKGKTLKEIQDSMKENFPLKVVPFQKL